MKTFKTLSGLLSASALAVGLAVVALPATAGIVGSLHDMPGSSGSATAGTDQICVFCHTPHGSNTDVQAPIWNKALPAGANYTAYTSSTMDGTAAVGSVSLACLSCHDGTQARDNMINQPGTGGYNAPGVGGSGGGGDLGTLGDMSGFGVANIGQDLSNDHPIGMVYCGAANDSQAIAGNCVDDSFNTAGSGVSGAAQVLGTLATRVWLETGGNSTYSKTDFPLYGDNQPGAKVECATCHDPHTPENGTFLRRVGGNSGSGVCLTCHNK